MPIYGGKKYLKQFLATKDEFTDKMKLTDIEWFHLLGGHLDTDGVAHIPVDTDGNVTVAGSITEANGLTSSQHLAKIFIQNIGFKGELTDKHPTDIYYQEQELTTDGSGDLGLGSITSALAQDDQKIRLLGIGIRGPTMSGGTITMNSRTFCLGGGGPTESGSTAIPISVWAECNELLAGDVSVNYAIAGASTSTTYVACVKHRWEDQ